MTDEHAIKFLETENAIKLVLLCHSVPERSRASLVTKIKKLKPTVPILMFYKEYSPTAAKVDGSLHSLETPETLLKMVGSMTQRVKS